MNELVVIKPRLPMVSGASEEFGISEYQWRVLIDNIFPSATSLEAISNALAYCKSRNLDIFKKPIHIVPMWSSALGRMVETVWPGIAEVRTTAARTGDYAGMDAVEYGPMVERTFTGFGKNNSKIEKTVRFPEWAKVTVYRLVHKTRCSFTAIVYWEETYSSIGKTNVPNDMWEKRPRGQLGKCAEAAALRMAFPEELGGMAVAEEMEGKVIDMAPVREILPAMPPEPEEDAQPAMTTLPPEPDDDAPHVPTVAEIADWLKTIPNEAALTLYWNETIKTNWKLFPDDAARQAIRELVSKRKAELTPKEEAPAVSIEHLAAEFEAAASKSPDFAVLDEAWEIHVNSKAERGQISRSDVEGIFAPIYEKHRNRIDFEDFPGGQ